MKISCMATSILFFFFFLLFAADHLATAAGHGGMVAGDDDVLGHRCDCGASTPGDWPVGKCCHSIERCSLHKTFSLYRCNDELEESSCKARCKVDCVPSPVYRDKPLYVCGDCYHHIPSCSKMQEDEKIIRAAWMSS